MRHPRRARCGVRECAAQRRQLSAGEAALAEARAELDGQSRRIDDLVKDSTAMARHIEATAEATARRDAYAVELLASHSSSVRAAMEEHARLTERIEAGRARLAELEEGDEARDAEHAARGRAAAPAAAAPMRRRRSQRAAGPVAARAHAGPLLAGGGGEDGIAGGVEAGGAGSAGGGGGCARRASRATARGHAAGHPTRSTGARSRRWRASRRDPRPRPLALRRPRRRQEDEQQQQQELLVVVRQRRAG